MQQNDAQDVVHQFVTHEKRKTSARVYDCDRTNGEVRLVRQFQRL